MRLPPPRELSYVLLDAVVYVAATVLVAVGIAALVATLAFESFWSGVVTVLFLLGWVVFGYATVLAWPPSHRPSRTPIGKLAKIGSGRSSGERDEGPLERQVARVQPDAWTLAPSRRFTSPVKLYASSLAILAASFAVERLLVV